MKEDLYHEYWELNMTEFIIAYFEILYCKGEIV
jgi:hypothetical protein